MIHTSDAILTYLFYLNIKVLRACERALLWDEAVYLYKEDGQYDSAVRTMIDHCVCFNHELFVDCVQKVNYVAVGDLRRSTYRLIRGF